MILGIDGSNLRQGGGLTHIIELLHSAEPNKFNFEKVYFWSNKQTLSKIKNAEWLEKKHQPELDQSLLKRQIWQRFKLKSELQKYKCDLIFVPGGSDNSGFKPMVTMCRNMLPFEWKELIRYGFSWMSIKLILLRLFQLRSFNKSDGLIFLTDYAKNSVLPRITNKSLNLTIIPHGIDDRFFLEPRESLSIENYSNANPFKILYVSLIDVYKHQVNVVKAIKSLILSGFPLQLLLVGSAYKPELDRLKKEMSSESENIKYLGAIDYTKLHEIYKTSNMNLFASSCENMPNTLLEGMASGLPVICSNLGPMPEILGNTGLYFNPENVSEIADSIKTMILNPKLRNQLSASSFARAKEYSWKKTAESTFAFLQSIAEKNLKGNGIPEN